MQRYFAHKDHSYSLLLFNLDLIGRKVLINRIGKDLANLAVKPDFTQSQYGFNTNYQNDSQQAINDFLNEDNILLKASFLNVTDLDHSVSFKLEIRIKKPEEEGLYTFGFYNCFQPDLFGKFSHFFQQPQSSSQNENASVLLSTEDGIYDFKSKRLEDVKYGIDLYVRIYYFFKLEKSI
jgi:hypothetical protein